MIEILYHLILQLCFVILFMNNALLRFSKASAASLSEKQLQISEVDVSQSTVFYGNDVNYVSARAVDGDEETCSKTLKHNPRWYNISVNREINLSRVNIIKKGLTIELGTHLDLTSFVVEVNNQENEDKFNVTVILIPRETSEIEWHCVDQDINALYEDSFNCSFPYKNPFIKTISIIDYFNQLKELIVCEIKVYQKFAASNFQESNSNYPSDTHNINAGESKTEDLEQEDFTEVKNQEYNSKWAHPWNK